jgi:GntR family transcriptional regulator
LVGQQYRRVADQLRELIASGELHEGDRLPSVREIAKRYNVTTGTAARALGVLRAEGLVVTTHGSGAYVRRFRTIRRRSPERLAREVWEAGHEIQDHDLGDRPMTRDVYVNEEPASDWVAEALGVESGTPVVYRSRRYFVEGRPVQLATSYLPLALVRGSSIAYTDVGPGGTYGRLAELGYAPVRFIEELRARMPTPDESARLGLTEGTPVVEIRRRAFTEEDRCVEVNRMVLDGSAYELVYQFSA